MKKKQLSKILKNLVPFSIALFVLLFIVIYGGNLNTKDNFSPKFAMASESDNISGYAWSENIGWISFNCEDGGEGQANICSTSSYGVGIGTDKKLSGYAWSENIGWITFNEGQLGGCPSGGGTCNARLDGNELAGWARALSGLDDLGDGWDGWISLESFGSVDYGVDLDVDTRTFGGYAWGGDEVVGWIEFNSDYSDGVTFTGEIPIIDIFQVEPRTITGEKPYVDWRTEGVARCDLTGGGYSVVNACIGSACAVVDNFLFNKKVEEETIYTLTCFSDIGLSTVATNRPTEFFELDANPSKVKIDFVGSSATTTPSVAIGVTAYNGFKGTVSFSSNVADVGVLPLQPSGLETSSATFSRPSMTYTEYSVGTKSNLEIFAAYRFIGEETVEVYGNGTESIEITIDAGNIDPLYEEI